jgi:hypothetical protein
MREKSQSLTMRMCLLTPPILHEALERAAAGYLHQLRFGNGAPAYRLTWKTSEVAQWASRQL